VTGSPRPRMVIVGPFGPPVTGASTVTRAFAAEAAKHFQVTVANTAPGQSARGVRRHAKRMALYIAAIVILIRQRPSFCYLSVQGGLGKLYDSACAVVARMVRSSLILHHHSFEYVNRQRAAAQGLHSIAGRSAIHVFLCESMRAGYFRWYSPSSSPGSFVISNAGWLPPSASVDRRTPRRRNELLVGHLSNLTKEKGTPVLGDVATLRDELDIRVLVAGPGQPSVLDRLVRSGVELVGPVYGGDKDAFLDQIDVFVFPSTYVHEAEPLVVLEALAHGAFVVASPCGCLPDILPKGAAQFTDPSDVREAVRLLAHDRTPLSHASGDGMSWYEDLRDEARKSLGDLFNQLLSSTSDQARSAGHSEGSEHASHLP
jgi:glycosyltransferase involved in cell wall biosynthesis